MSAAGKKGKRSKGTVISLQSFLSNGDVPAGTTQVTKKVRNVDGDESDDGVKSLPLVYQLPTAPRANRIFDDNSIPHKPPYIAYLTNLPFDANEDDINMFFGSTQVVSLRLPREDGDTGRVRGFGYVEFGTREDLIDVLSLPDPTIKGRRIRIEISNENEQQNNRQRSNRRGFDGFNNSGENRDSTNWRRDNQVSDTGSNFERGFNRDRKYTSEDSSTPGSWRTGSRPIANNVSPQSERSNEHLGEKNMKTWNVSGHEHNRVHTFNQMKDEPQEERPKLNLKPRTLPLPEISIKSLPEDDVQKEENNKFPKVSGAPPEKVFGSAKPVDTASRELEIEERLSEARRQDILKRESDQVDINKKFSELQFEATNKENTNSTTSWRRRIESSQNNKSDGRKYSPNRLETTKIDDRRHDKDVNRYIKSRDKNDRLEISKNKQLDTKLKDDSKLKRETKSERPPPRYQINQSAPILQSANKYSGLDDEASD